MKRVFGSDKILISILSFIVIAVFLLTYGKMGNLYIDCGREAYIPWQMLKGELLYRDIFNIYAPGAYFINALLFKIFSPHLNVLLFAALFTFIGITSLLYMIARRFLSKYNSFILSVIILLLTSFSGNVFNFFYPYSFAVIYGLLAVLCSLYFIIRSKSETDYYLSAFFAGVAAVNKYEYILYLIPLFYFIIRDLKSVKKVLYSIFAYCSFPLFLLCVLFVQGLTFSDIFKEILIIKEIFNSECFKYFYSSSGLSLSKEHIPLVLGTLTCFLVSFGLFRKFGIVGKLFGILLCYCAYKFYIFRYFVFLPFLILGLFIYRYKDLPNLTRILLFSYFAIVLKVFSGMMLYSYGHFFIGLSLVVFLVLLPIKYRKTCLEVLLALSLFLAWFGYTTIAYKNHPVKTPQGTLYGMEYSSSPFIQVYEYLEKVSKPTDRVLAFPEMPMLNFLLQRDNDNYIYSLIPMYIEVFEEEYIIQYLDTINAEFIVINHFDMASYGVHIFGKDYAWNIMRYIEQNYDKVFETDKGLKHIVYRRKQ